MASKGKTQLLITFVATPDQVAKVDALVASHAAWIGKTHPRDGATGLLSYNFAKGAERANPLDPGSDETGNTRYVLNEIYETPPGVIPNASASHSVRSRRGEWSARIASRRRLARAR